MAQTFLAPQVPVLDWEELAQDLDRGQQLNRGTCLPTLLHTAVARTIGIRACSSTVRARDS